MKSLYNIKDEGKVSIKVVNKSTNTTYVNKVDLHTTKETITDVSNLQFEIDGGFWDSLDWEKEPDADFDTLLAERASQIRNGYKYVILYYSGGIDSDTVLRVFIKNNIPLDEVVITRVCFDPKDPPLLDIELAIEKLKRYSKFIPKTKINIINITPDVLNKFSKEQNWIDSHYNGTIGNFRRLQVHNYNYFGAYNADYITDNIAHVYAELKPIVKKINNKWYTKLYGFGMGSMATNEPFYSSRSLPELHIKQCHLVKNYFKNLNFDESILYSPPNSKNIIISENNAFARRHIELACRWVKGYDSSYQPEKYDGLGKDLITDKNNEDSLIYKHMKKYTPELFHNYVDGVVKPILTNSNSAVSDNSRLDILKFSFGKEHYIGE